MQSFKNFFIESASALTRQKKIFAQEKFMKIDNENPVSQSGQQINKHIESYLDYYCGLADKPGFAVLLKGEWGSGKTWFINRYRENNAERNEKRGQRFLYISLYGMTELSDIEYAFFQQLHPVLSSKGIALASTVLKGILRGTLKIDLDHDQKDDGTITIQIPEINLPEYLENTDKSILIFDDLERCKIDINNLLGYINYFVEQQGLKVVLVANEKQILDEKAIENDIYKSIKEKLIGKTFTVLLDFEGALENFILRVENEKVRNFLSDNIRLIEDLYQKARYENLRCLKRIILDFERVYEKLPEKAKNKTELLQDLLKLLMAFSIEISKGNLMADKIEKLKEEYFSYVSSQFRSNHTPNIPDARLKAKDNTEINSLQEILSRYSVLNLHSPFPSLIWWQSFFDRGIINTDELEQSVTNSKYFKSENTPNWVKLWHCFDLSDDEFDDLLEKFEFQLSNREFSDLGIVKHAFGLLFFFSENQLYPRERSEILKNAKLYVDYLRKEDPVKFASSSVFESNFNSYQSLGFQGKELEEFQEFSSYINEARVIAKAESMPTSSKDLLATMQSHPWRFYKMVSLSNLQDGEVVEQRYYEVPILHYIEAEEFVGTLLIMQPEDRRCVFWALSERYKIENLNRRLTEELDWIKAVKQLLLQEAERKAGKISGLDLRMLIKHYLDEAIQNLETAKEIE